jgi:hypothetical protein
MEIVQHAKRDCDIVGDNNLLLLFAGARAWATLALVDPGPFESVSGILALQTVQHRRMTGQWLCSSHIPQVDMD